MYSARRTLGATARLRATHSLAPLKRSTVIRQRLLSSTRNIHNFPRQAKYTTNHNVKVGSSNLILMIGGLAAMKSPHIRTWCNNISDNNAVQQQPSSNNTLAYLQEHSALDLIVPSLQALLRVLRLLQTTGLIVLDYEWYKVAEKASKIIQKYASRTTSSTNSQTQQLSKEELFKLSKSQLQDYWEHQVQTRHAAFEQAQMTYARPSPKDQCPQNMTYEEWKQAQKQAMREAAAEWVQAEEELQKLGGSQKSQLHRHAAQKLVRLCRSNAGVYIKIGQHLANLDYLIPPEYIQELSCLLDDAPTSTYDSVCRVVTEDLGASPDQLFDNFNPTPIASASLAQVHVAYDKATGRKLAIKVQHEGLRETCRGDLLALVTVVHALEFFFEDFNFGWIADEIAPQLPLELDFHKEGQNSEKAAACLQARNVPVDDVVIPKVLWQHTSDRVLCMEFEEGFRATNVEAIQKAGLKPRDVSLLISKTFHSQTFLDAWVHCDPHPANVLLRKNETTGKPQMVLVDHGLYKQLDDNFRITYATLWKALMQADIPAIQQSCKELGVDGMLYTLLSGLLTARPFDEVVERSKTGRLSANSASNNKSQQDQAVIRGYAEKFLVDILTMIDQLPRQMVLLLKMNDCLRHIDYALGSSPTQNLVVAGQLAAQAVYEHKVSSATTKKQGRWQRLQAWWDYNMVLWRIWLYDWGNWWVEMRRQNNAKALTR